MAQETSTIDRDGEREREKAEREMERDKERDRERERRQRGETNIERRFIIVSRIGISTSNI